MAEDYQVEYIHPDEIIVKERLREDVGDLSGLVESIRKNGLLNILTVEMDGRTLIAGERRLRALKLLGYTLVPVHRHSGDPADSEFDENEFREGWTLGEAEKYYRRKGRGVTQKEKGVIAQETGHSLGTMKRMTRIREIAESENTPPSVREVALRELADLQDKTIGAAPALSRVLAALRVARRDGESKKIASLLPGQRMHRRSRASAIELPARLWKAIGDANTQVIASLATEIQEDPEIPEGEIRQMLTELNLRVKEVDSLKKRLRAILDERKFRNEQ